MPDVGAFTDQQALLALQDGCREPVRLHALLVARTTAGTVDGGWADDSCLHAVRGSLAGSDDDLVDVTVQGIVRETDKLFHAVPVVVFPGSFDAPGVGAEVLYGENACARGVDDPHRVLRGVVGSSLGDSLG